MAKNWIGVNSGTGLWSLGSNWSKGTAPTLSSDIASITEAGTYKVLITAADPSYTIRNLTVGDAGSSPTLQVDGQLNVQKLISLDNGSSLDVESLGTTSASRLNVASGATVTDLGTLNVSGALVGRGAVNVSGGQLFANTVAGNNTYTLASNSTMTISNSISGSGAIVFGDGTPDTLNLDTAGSSFNAAVSGFSGGDIIDIGSLAYSSAYTSQYSNNTFTINDGANTVFTFSDIDDPGFIHLLNDGAGGTEIVTCFLAGTRILTEHGEVNVEHLDVGTMVATLVGDAVVYQPIKWVGSWHLDAKTVRRTATYPIRILANAFSQGVPRRELLVTPEHCIYLEGRLIPARMLVNSSSIIEDRAMAAFDVYHIELEAHGVLLAEGLATESYLDTGNRGVFYNAAVTQLFSALTTRSLPKSWTTDACAPLATNRETVEPIWLALAERASQLGLQNRRCLIALLDDPRLRILLDDGRVLAGQLIQGGRHVFQVPVGAKPVRLQSRASVPASVLGPFVDDRRSLGVQVKSITLANGSQSVVIDAEELNLAGWHAAEPCGRWTDGDATLDLPVAATRDTVLEIHVVGTLPYQQEDLTVLAA